MTPFAGTGTLARLVIRRDRIRLTVWVYAIAATMAATASSFHSLYPTEASRLAFARTIEATPTLLALDGPVFNGATIGGLTAWRFAGIAAVLAALMSVLTVVRHTRAEEEAGRTELVGAGVVGRFAPITAVLAVIAATNVVVGGLVALLLTLLGTGATGAIALGAGLAAAGISFAAIAAVAAQIPEGSRAANGIAVGTLAATFLLRAIGDAARGGRLAFLSWLSPIGWTQQVRPYADERWWVLALAAGFSVLLVGVAYRLVARRDMGAGLRPTRLGPARAVASLRTPLALAWRQHRGPLLGWGIGFLLAGLAFGSAAKGIGSLINTSKQLRQIIDRLGGSGFLSDTFLATVLGIVALVASAYAIQGVLRARGEETALRVEVLLATPVRRVAFASGHVALALAGAAVLLLAAGFGAGLAYGISVHDVGGQLGRVIGAALAQWPAAVIPAGVAVALFGLAPRAAAGTAWGLLGAFALLGQLGPILRVAQSVMDVSPFTHTPKLPGGPVAALPFVAMSVVALALTALGLASFRRRDIG